MANLEIKEAILVRFKIVNNNHQQDSGVFYTLIFKKPIGQLIDIFPENFIFLKHLIQNFQNMELWLTDQNSKLLKLEDKKNTT